MAVAQRYANTCSAEEFQIAIETAHVKAQPPDHARTGLRARSQQLQQAIKAFRSLGAHGPGKERRCFLALLGHRILGARTVAVLSARRRPSPPGRERRRQTALSACWAPQVCAVIGRGYGTRKMTVSREEYPKSSVIVESPACEIKSVTRRVVRSP